MSTIDNREMIILGLQQREAVLKIENRQLRAETERLRAALVEANKMVCLYHQPYGWPEFQRRFGLPTASEVRAALETGSKEPR